MSPPCRAEGRSRFVRGLACGLMAVLTTLTGCASLSEPQRIAPMVAGAAQSARIDPLEPLNRQMLRVNLFIDDVALRPAARVYDRLVPGPVQALIGNMLSNLLDPWIAVNNLLQGKPQDAASDLGRFLMNSTLGLAGMIDVATETGLGKHNEDFGQTLAVWGVPAGPYLMLPGLGPSTIRDALAFTVDYSGSIKSRIDSQGVRLSMTGLDVLQARVRALPAQAMMDQALDRYLLIRDVHLQRRRSQIYDGDPPESP
jgi:phospholipid-binding lipoprotein MlaA